MKTLRRRPVMLKLRNSAREQFRCDVVRGLLSLPKELPCKYFYDETGSKLFERITELDEYYPTRTERDIMRRHAAEIAGILGRRCLVIEYGSGNSSKTRLLLDHLQDAVGYIPVDVSTAYLQRSAQALAKRYPRLQVLPCCADFTHLVGVPSVRERPARRIVYFPGSTVGNLTPLEIVALFQRTAALCGPGGGLLLGADLHKDRDVLEAAYNDAQGVTAAFNRNILVRINRELEGTFAVKRFAHRAFYRDSERRIEMHLVSTIDQRARVAGASFYFPAGTSIRTEYSHKFTLDDLHRLTAAAGFTMQRVWTDPRDYFSVSFSTVQQTV